MNSGPNGVGINQFTACTACKSYGAVVSTKPGNEGHIIGGHCFNTSCHNEHKTAYKALIASATAEPAANQSDNAQSLSPTGKAPAATGPKSATKPGANSPAKPQEVKKAIKREAFTLFSQMGSQAIQANPSYSLAIAIVSMYLDMRSDLPSELLTRLQKALGLLNSVQKFPDSRGKQRPIVSTPVCATIRSFGWRIWGDINGHHCRNSAPTSGQWRDHQCHSS